MAIPMQTIVNGFKQSIWLIDAHCQDLSHTDSLLQLPFRGNCLNWVLGHILEARHDLMRYLGLKLVATDVQMQRYKSGSAPIIKDKPDVMKLSDILDLFHQSQPILEDGLLALNSIELGKVVREDIVHDFIFRMYFHETFHIGQLEILRQLAGKNDKVF